MDKRTRYAPGIVQLPDGFGVQLTRSERGRTPRLSVAGLDCA